VDTPTAPDKGQNSDDAGVEAALDQAENARAGVDVEVIGSLSAELEASGQGDAQASENPVTRVVVGNHGRTPMDVEDAAHNEGPATNLLTDGPDVLMDDTTMSDSLSHGHLTTRAETFVWGAADANPSAAVTVATGGLATGSLHLPSDGSQHVVVGGEGDGDVDLQGRVAKRARRL
jgi:hypothetical protein